MAFPSGIVPIEDQVDFGIVVGVYPSSDERFNIEFQRMTTATTWATVQTWNGGDYNAPLQFRDPLPNDNKTRSYRARHAYPGYTAGSWTATVSAKPTLLGNSEKPQLALSARPVGVPFILSTATSLRFGRSTGAGLFQSGANLIGKTATGGETTLTT